MAASNVTGSARIRAAQSNASSRNLRELTAEIATRMDDIRAAVRTSIDSLRCQNIRTDADIAAVLQRRALEPLDELAQHLGKFEKPSR